VEKKDDPQREWNFEQGNKVDVFARKLFPGGVHVRSFDEHGAEDTRRRIEEGEKCLFQATAMAEGLLAMADIIRLDPIGKTWDIYEVKGTTEVKDEHLYDVWFQKTAFEKAGYKVGKLFVVHVNKKYMLHGEVDPSGFFIMEEVTKEAAVIGEEVKATVEKAKRILALPDAPTQEDAPCSCSPKTGPCPAHCFPGLPEQSVFSLRRLPVKKARALYDKGIKHLCDVPVDYPLNDAQAF